MSIAMSTTETNGWTNVNLADVSTAYDLLPAGKYTFQVLPGAKYSDFRPGQVDLPAAVVGGEQNGKRVFISYPNPAEFDWSPKAFKRLTEVIGTDVEAGETPVAYLNRTAGLRFQMTAEIVKDKNNIDRQRFGIFKPEVAL